MTRYLIMVAHGPGESEGVTTMVRQRHIEAYAAFEQHVQECGRRVSWAPLADADTATTIRHRGGRTVVTDGPLEGVETVTAYYDVELPDLDEAIGAAKLLPPSCTVEIRPTVDVW